MTTTRSVYTGRYPNLKSPIWPTWVSRWLCRRYGHGILREFNGELYCRMCGMDARNIQSDAAQDSSTKER